MGKDRKDEKVARGAVVNGLGMAGKLLIPLFFVIGPWLYGPSVMGTYYLSYVIIELAVALGLSGFNDGILMFASRYRDNSDKQDLLYQALANALVFSSLLVLALILFSRFVGPDLLQFYRPDPELLHALQVMVFGLPAMVISVLVVAATKSALTMKWDALLMGGLRPLLFILMAFTFYPFGWGVTALAWGYVVSQWVVACCALIVFRIYFSYTLLWDQLKKFRLFPPLLGFALPQNLNMAFNTTISNLDVLMLGYFGFQEAAIFVYGMGAQVARNVRQVKLAFSDAFVPVLARLHGAGDSKGMNELFSTVTRWIITIALPLLLTVAMFRREILHIFVPTYTGDSFFMLLLLIVPLLSCGFGLAGNTVVMTGHAKWNLLNSLFVAAANISLNYFLIPRFGLVGAAMATAIAVSMLSLAQIIEARYLAHVSLRIKQVYKPYVATIAPALILVFSLCPLSDSTFTSRFLLWILAIGLYCSVLVMMKIPAEDLDAFFPKGLSAFTNRNKKKGCK